MSVEHERFLLRAEQLLNKLVETVKGGGGGGSGGGRAPHVITQLINPDSTFNFDSKTLLVNPAGYDLLSTRVEVMLLDTDSGSPTNGFYINPEASVTWGINTDGIVRVHNYRPDAVTVRIQVYRPTVTIEV